MQKHQRWMKLQLSPGSLSRYDRFVKWADNILWIMCELISVYFQKGVVAHEFGHALGFQHEQTRPDRDRYVRIHTQNIAPQTLFNFNKYNWNMLNAYNVPYDYESIMHYGKTVSHLKSVLISITHLNNYRHSQ